MEPFTTPTNNNNRETLLNQKCCSFSPNTTPKSISAARNSLINLDAVALDRIFSFLGDEELRRFHQVSRGCKAALEIRPLINKRRLDLVARIRENKENIQKKLAAHNLIPEVTPPTRINRDGFKPGTLLLVDCKNLLQNISPSTPSSDNRSDRSITPVYRFPFQAFEDAEKQLQSSGQQQMLVPSAEHGRVSSGVSSPSTPVITGSAKTIATRCRLISRMAEGLSPTKLAVTVIIEPEFPFVALKKSKSHSPMPSLESPSPSWSSSIEVPRSRSLGEITSCKVSNAKRSLRRIAKLKL